MSLAVVGGATLQCSFGMATSSLTVLPTAQVMNGMPVATIMDQAPLVNIMSFGMCTCTANPTVAAATAAALGVLTPMPCVPVIPSPWTPGSSTVLVGGQPALNQTCQCMCAYGGVIQIVSSGTTNLQVP